MAENNSISTLLPELLRLFNNSLESFEKVNQAITSNRDSVTVNIQNEDGTNSRVTIPSFGFLKNSVDRLQSNINAITNVGGGSSSVRLADGTFRKLVLQKLPTEAPDLTSINSVNQFNIKPNWFFEELINPLLYISFDLTGQVPIDTERAIIQRYILDTNTQAKIQFFENTYSGKADIDYFTFLQQIVERNISYVLDEAVVDLPPRTKRYSGKFSVTRITEVDFTEEVNGVSVTSQKKQYKLNKIFYTDSEADFDDTIQLKVGDSVEVVSNPVDTRYIVKSVDSSTNTAILDLVEGVRPILIGADILKIGSAINDNVQVDVTVGFNERCITFVKPIDPDSKIPSVNWSPGSGFYTNTLTTIAEDGTLQTLAEYYQRYAVDFGKFLLSFAEDKIPTSREGLIPNAPQPATADFKVALINGQVTNSDAVVQLQDLNNQKNTLDSTLKELDTAISQYRTKIQTTNYANNVERDADRNALQGLITERSSQAELYASIVKEIAAKSSDNSVASITPKYRARGFWPMPQEKSTPATGSQSIVKFKIRYRYLSQDGAANPVDQFTFVDGGSESQGAFSNYEIIESVLRPRSKNPITGLYQWAPINNDNADAVNINQLDIAIRKGEILEVQVKSISEAGWPSNPLESEWSEPVRIEFPADLSSDSAVEAILAQNKQDLAKVSLQETLNAKGIDEHLSSAFVANEKYYAHGAQVIASGFLSENQTPIDLFTKLAEMQARLDEFTEILRNASGELAVTLIDDQGNTINLNRNSTTKVFAGFYFNEVKALDDPRGAIVSKTFFINIANSEQTGLRLISRVAGSRGRMTKQSENPGYTNTEAANGTVILPATYSWLDNSATNQSDGRPTYLTNDTDYNTVRKYDLVPILLTNPSVTSSNKYGQMVSLSPYQSTQNKNQFIYARFKDVSSEESFYNYINPEDDYTFNLDTCENFFLKDNFSSTATSGQFIWGGGFDATGAPTTASSYDLPQGDQSIEVHITHPWVTSYTAYRAAYISLTGDTTTLPATLVAAIDCTAPSGNGTARVMFRQSKFIPLFSDQPKGKQQSIYLNENPSLLDILSGTAINFNSGQTLQASPTLMFIPALSDPTDPGFINYSRNVKTSFETFDQYGLGKQSCGSYLFVSADDHQVIQTDGDSIQSSKIIQFGSANSINIPIVFQYRMTDYYGVGSGSAGGIGNIAGDLTGATTNLTYAKKIGFDIWVSGTSVTQYDVEIFAKYKSDNLNIDVFPAATVTKGLGDLERVISNLRPSITETTVNQSVRSGGGRGNAFISADSGDFIVQ
jgi:hypothetical protein